jgi:hypothetical protein
MTQVTYYNRSESLMGFPERKSEEQGAPREVAPDACKRVVSPERFDLDAGANCRAAG